eukprot:TRINITY_DN8709_c0_g2_i1.p1 TRINITY_DN8709_c0_g2~~TRINITY_DN8709_c0_g2_i1.p1  ORF type:complete len:979 (+),score=302.59 TRINITY_DN8709_c0_g2_i1:83-3019(+)
MERHPAPRRPAQPPPYRRGRVVLLPALPEAPTPDVMQCTPTPPPEGPRRASQASVQQGPRRASLAPRQGPRLPPPPQKVGPTPTPPGSPQGATERASLASTAARRHSPPAHRKKSLSLAASGGDVTLSAPRTAQLILDRSRAVADHCSQALRIARTFAAPQDMVHLCLTSGGNVLWQAASVGSGGDADTPDECPLGSVPAPTPPSLPARTPSPAPNAKPLLATPAPGPGDANELLVSPAAEPRPAQGAPAPAPGTPNTEAGGTVTEMPAVGAIRERTSKAFRRVCRSFKREVAALQRSLNEAEGRCGDMQTGGAAYAVLLRERDWLERCCSETTEKIQDLLDLLSRAGARLSQLEEVNSHLQSLTDAPQKVDWGILEEAIEDLNLGITPQRKDEEILRELIAYLQSVQAQSKQQTQETEAMRQRMSDLVTRLEAAESQGADARIQIEELQSELEASQKNYKRVKEQWRRDAARAEEAQKRVEPLEEERLALLNQVMQLKSEMARALSHTKSHFVGLGKLKTVPVYLRYSGKLSNLHIDKGVLENFISAVWAGRQQEWVGNALPTPRVAKTGSVRKLDVSAVQSPAKKKAQPYLSNIRVLVATMKRWEDFEVNERIDYGNVPLGVVCNRTLPEFVHNFIIEKYKNPGEWAYSMVDACSRFKYDADVELFQRILTGDLPEDAYYDQTVMIEKFRGALVVEDQRRGRVSQRRVTIPDEAMAFVVDTAERPSGLLPPALVLSVLGRFFPAKSAASRIALRSALFDDIGLKVEGPTDEAVQQALDGAADAKYNDLFSSDAKGNQGQFMECLRDQYVEELMTNTTDVLQCIQSADGQGCPEGTVLLCVVKFQVLVWDSAPEKDVDRWVWLLTRDSKTQWPGHAVAVGEVRWHEPYDTAKLTERARKLLCKRYGHRPPPVERISDLLTWIELPDCVAEKFQARASAALRSSRPATADADCLSLSGDLSGVGSGLADGLAKLGDII